jgi:precorrin-6A/cobalt-precorrin-6A reductase
MKVLLLGGTTEAGVLARALAEAGVDAVYSYAGRTAAPMGQPLPVRAGGFGGAEGLAAALVAGGFTHLVDATHPFAATISRNALNAAAAAGVAFLALERPPWTPGPGDRWTDLPDIPAAVAALATRPPARVFLAIGRQTLAPFAALRHHRFLLRLVDAPDAPLPLPGAEVVVDRGPFTPAGDEALMRARGIEVVVAKNAGGTGAAAKLAAARTLGLPVLMVGRPALPDRPRVPDVAGVMAWLGHPAAPAPAGA